MDAPIQHVPRPGSSPETQENQSANTFVIQRNTLTLYISFAAIILSCASAAVNLFTFYGGGQQKMVNEADQIFVRAEANRVLKEMARKPGSHSVLAEELKKLYQDLRYHPPSTAKLDVYEWMAFGIAVETYSIPLTTVQMQVMKAFEVGHSVNAIAASRCITDPHADGCEGITEEVKRIGREQHKVEKERQSKAIAAEEAAKRTSSPNLK